MKKPNEFVEVFLSLVKWFLIVLLINNAIWLGVVYCLVSGTNDEESAVLTQSGENNVQGINNGSIH